MPRSRSAGQGQLEQVVGAGRAGLELAVDAVEAGRDQPGRGQVGVGGGVGQPPLEASVQRADQRGAVVGPVRHDRRRPGGARQRLADHQALVAVDRRCGQRAQRGGVVQQAADEVPQGSGRVRRRGAGRRGPSGAAGRTVRAARRPRPAPTARRGSAARCPAGPRRAWASSRTRRPRCSARWCAASLNSIRWSALRSASSWPKLSSYWPCASSWSICSTASPAASRAPRSACRKPCWRGRLFRS